VSLAHKSHPELEYFRPLWNFLRKTGIALAFICLGVIGGALVLWAGHDSRAVTTSMTAGVNAVPSSAPTTPVAEPVTATTTAERPASPQAGTAACEEDTWAYLDGKCSSGKPRKLRPPRAATDGSLGRRALPGPAASRTPAKLATGADAASAPAAVKPTDQSNSAPQKARKTASSPRKTASSQGSGRNAGKANSSSRDERGRDERWSARAYASPDGRNPSGPYERSWDWSR
jgi:hypothetical protein